MEGACQFIHAPCMKQVQWNVLSSMRNGYVLAGGFKHWSVVCSQGVTNAFFPHLDISIAPWSDLLVCGSVGIPLASDKTNYTSLFFSVFQKKCQVVLMDRW